MNDTNKRLPLSKKTMVMVLGIVVILVVLLFMYLDTVPTKLEDLKKCDALKGQCSSVACRTFGRAKLQMAEVQQGEGQGCDADESYCCSIPR